MQLKATEFIYIACVKLSFMPYSYVINNPLKYTDPTGNEIVGGASWRAQQAAWEAGYQNHIYEYTSWTTFLNAEKRDFFHDVMGPSGGGQTIGEVNMGEGYTSIYDNSASAFKRNYYAFRSDLKQNAMLYERYGGMLPTAGSGGLTSSFEGFKNFMLDQARYNSIEVGAFAITYDNTNIQYYVMPWDRNTSNDSYVNIKYLPNNTSAKYIAHYHTHPEIGLKWGEYVKPGPSRDDAIFSQKFSIDAFVLCPDGLLWKVERNHYRSIIPRHAINYGEIISKW
jgi:hypothetical protein